MTASKLPEITLTCGNGHQFTTRAAGGQTVRCKVCTKPKHVPTDRPTTAKEAAAYQAAAVDDHQDQEPERGPGAELAARWDREAEWTEVIKLVSGRPGDECPECSAPLHWEPGRTMTYCTECNRVDLPAAVSAHYDRQDRQRSEVAVRAAPNKSAERESRVRLRALKDQAGQSIRQWLETIANDECYDQVQWQRQARALAASLRGYLPEIADAADESELAEVTEEVGAILERDEGRSLLAAYDQAQERAERQQAARERTAELAAHQQKMAKQQERERIEAEREARRRASEVDRQRKAIASEARPRPAPTPATVTMNDLAVAMAAQRLKKEKDLEAKGACQFKHTFGQAVAERLFGVPARAVYNRMTGYSIANTPQYRACAKHYAEAEKRLNREGYADVAYWDLPIQQPDPAPGNYWGL